ncbi:SpaA isopeptide-forming pilin-related protein [Companilactobacillus ginsenosidimutans]|uniref:Gram-positive cocci surface proteins LPxTG domain-containing protein n=1 Tax=Companilactobacillus ginsenosidimutans TaxID=1007676 RepID=A0A0H4QM71_9LACO|nr:SpaA isopeptide-forming pilin-related protein [Companilactobacillus ginsenosidimutans]AKP67808.1 hypothetical protein ABM34_09875 [Companilactobacillus ginsenosidimutans]
MKRRITFSILFLTSILVFIGIFNLFGSSGSAYAATTTDTTPTSSISPTVTSPTTTTSPPVTSPTATTSNSTVSTTSTSPTDTQTKDITVAPTTSDQVASTTSTVAAPVTSTSTQTASATDTPVPVKEIPMKGNTAADASINSGAISPGDTTYVWSDYNVGYNWSIPDYVEINAGDTATFTIPDNINVTQKTTFDVKDPKGNVIGSFTILPGQKTGTLTFNDALENTTTGRVGTISFTAKGTSDSDENKDFILNKYGWINTTTAASTDTQASEGIPTSLTWNVAFNSASQDLTHVVLTDTIEPGQTFVRNSVRANYGYMLNGKFISQGEIVPDSVELVGNQLIIKFSNVSSYVDLYYDTTVQNVSTDQINKWHDKTTITADQISSEAEHTIEWGGAGTGEGAKGSIIFTKLNSVTNSPISGAVFEIRNSAGKVIQEGLTTNEKGIIEADDLAPGDYVIVETQVPDGYEPSANYEWPFTIVEGENDPVLLTGFDKPFPEEPGTGEEIVYKVDSADNQALVGAEFKLLDAEGNVVASPLKTDAQGILDMSDLAPGQYSLVEITAPEGYELNSTPIAFEVIAGKTASVYVKDVKLPTDGSLTVLKVDSETKKPLAGATFNILDSTGKVVKTGLTTDEKGQIVVDALPDGSYTLVETTAPEGYDDLKDPIAFTITAGKATSVTVPDEESEVVPPEPPVQPEEPDEDDDNVVEPSEPEPEPQPVPEPEKPSVTTPGKTPSGTIDKDTSGYGKLPQTGNDKDTVLEIVGLILSFVLMMSVISYRKLQH